MSKDYKKFSIFRPKFKIHILKSLRLLVFYSSYFQKQILCLFSWVREQTSTTNQFKTDSQNKSVLNSGKLTISPFSRYIVFYFLIMNKKFFSLKAMTFQNCFRKCCGKEEVFPEPESESPTPKNSWEKLRALKEEIAKPAKTWEDKPRSSANPIKRYRGTPLRPETWLPIRPDTWLPIRPHTPQFGCANDCL